MERSQAELIFAPYFCESKILVHCFPTSKGEDIIKCVHVLKFIMGHSIIVVYFCQTDFFSTGKIKLCRIHMRNIVSSVRENNHNKLFNKIMFAIYKHSINFNHKLSK